MVASANGLWYRNGAEKQGSPLRHRVAEKNEARGRSGLCGLGCVPVVGAQRGQRAQRGAVLAGVAGFPCSSPLCPGLVR